MRPVTRLLSSAVSSSAGCGTVSPPARRASSFSLSLSRCCSARTLGGTLEEFCPVSSAQAQPAAVPTSPFSRLALSTLPRPRQSRKSKQLVRRGTMPSFTTLEYNVRLRNLRKTKCAGPVGRILSNGFAPGSSSLLSFCVFPPRPPIIAFQPPRALARPGGFQVSPRSCPVRPTRPKSRANFTYNGFSLLRPSMGEAMQMKLIGSIWSKNVGECF